MDTMIGDEKNLKDLSPDHDSSFKDSSRTVIFGKLNKLITALYMVTDIMDKEEPLKAKLRQLGAEVISEAHQSPARTVAKISEIVSFLDIASTVGMISAMNSGILKKEFFSMKTSLEDAYGRGESVWLEKLVSSPVEPVAEMYITQKIESKNYQGQSTRLGVQKGGTLLKALSDKIMTSKETRVNDKEHHRDGFDLLKQQRRNEVLKIIREAGDATITDIKNRAKAIPAGVLANCGDKTLQRELLSMLKDNLLKKTGEKRWSKYSIA